eukprot:COSAG01_NODE_6106_length_3848_cov_1.384102_3_plen_53_part_00
MADRQRARRINESSGLAAVGAQVLEPWHAAFSSDDPSVGGESAIFHLGTGPY